MSMQRIPLLVVPPHLASVLSRPLRGAGALLARLLPGLRYDLQESDLTVSAEEHAAIALLNSMVFFLLSGALFIVLGIVQGKQPAAALQGSWYALLIFFLVLAALLRYPRVLAGKKAELIDKHLIFALKDLLLQIGAGVTLYAALVNVANAGYGAASREFEKVARAVSTGTPIDKALERMALASTSEFLRRTTWQLIATLKAGASLQGALRSLIDDLTLDQRDRIQAYARELNLWSLLYLLFAVAVPTIGATLLVILSSFAGVGVTKGVFILFLALSFAVQLILIGFVKTRRPLVVVS